MEPESWPLCLLLFLGRAEGPWLLLTAKALLKCEILEDYTCFTSIMIDIGYGNATSPCLQYHWINCS